jgi:hypothetical protein
MPDDAPKLLPKHVVSALLRALATIRRRPQPPRLVLRRAEFGRVPGWDDKNDYNVLWRGQVVGRIHKFDRYDTAPYKGFAWHWYWRDAPDRKDAQGHAHSLEEAMSDFRNAWDDAAPKSGARSSG